MKSFPVLMWKEEDVYVSCCPITRVSSYGDTEVETINHHKEALELFLEGLPEEKVRKITDSIPPGNMLSVKTISLSEKKS